VQSIGPILARPGQVLDGRYRIERPLARGGHGAVFVAEQLATEAKVAVKILLPHVIDSEEARERFELEAKVAGRVGSEFIVRVIDAAVDGPSGLPFLAMELLEGESLAEAVQRHGPFNAMDTATCLLQVAQGLDRAHAHRSKTGKPAPIIHRDLKPENLFMTTREDGERVTKILDFGVAKIASESAVRSQTVNGSPLYMAYEQLVAGPLSPQTDVWALGLIAFFLLTGRSYWRVAEQPRADLVAIFAEILHMPIVPPSARASQFGISPSWPTAFDTWFLRCVAREPQARFPSAGEAARALLDALLGHGSSDTLALGEAPAASVHAPRRRARPMFVLSASALLVGMVGYLALRNAFESGQKEQDATGIVGTSPSTPVPEPPRAAPAPEQPPEPADTPSPVESLPVESPKELAKPIQTKTSRPALRGRALAPKSQDSEPALSSSVYSER
jgi:eukaryotic-like serine/threonine-protein kinase